MSDAAFLELSNYAGLTATAVLTFNFLLGMMLATAYKTNPYWKRLPANIQKTDVNAIHNYTAYIALLLVLLHVWLLLLDKSSKFTFVDIVFPLNAPHQSFAVALGTMSLFALSVVIITTQKLIKKKMSFRTWKNIHLISYVTAILFVLHGMLMDPHLKDSEPDFFDGEKLLSFGCGLVLIAAAVMRYKFYIRNKSEV